MRSALVATLLGMLTACSCGGSPAPGGEDGGAPDSGGGADAGTGADGGAPDAGAADAGRDAGAIDAGPDAGAVDAGPDAGPVDAGPDAGAIDAGADAGPSCGGSGQVCCSPAACGSGLVCAAGTCVPPVSSYSCPGGAPEVVFVSEVAPPATMAPYASFDAALVFANCGAGTWNATAVGAPDGYKLGFDAPRDYDTWGAGRVALPADVPPGSQVTIPVRVRATPLTGPHGYAWAIVHEGVAWLAGQSPSHTIDVEATPATATICAGVQADVGGGVSASAQLQQCIDATASGGTLELPAGVYRMTSELSLSKPITVRSAGTAGLTTGCLAAAGPACAIFRADDNLDVPRGFVRFGATSGVVFEHLVLDGNRDRRLASAAAATCAAGTNGAGFNAATAGCVGCAFRWGVSARALCGTGWEWRGDSAAITDCAFRENGAHGVKNMWSDGLTLLESNGAVVTGNRNVDNSDVDLIFGGGTSATVQGNVIEHHVQSSYAGLMLDNFDGSTSGDFTGTVVSGNVVLCGAQQCDFAIQLGPHPWYLSANIAGGTVSGNTALGGRINVNAEGAGTAAAPMTVTGNSAGPAPGTATYECGQSRPGASFNVSPDSVVDVGAGPAATASFQFHTCP